MKGLMPMWMCLGFVILVVGIRVMAGYFLKEERPAVRLGLALGLFGVYTGILLLFLYVMYLSALKQNMGIYEFYAEIVLIILGTNAAAASAGVMYWGMRRKRKISEIEKARLKDM